MPSPTAPIIDTFTGNDSQTLSVYDATYFEPSGGFIRLNNRAKANINAANNREIYQVAYGPGAEVYFTVRVLPSNTQAINVFLRLSDNDPFSEAGAHPTDGYYFRILMAAGAETMGLRRLDDSVVTALGADVTTTTLNVNDLVWLNAAGTTLTGYIAGTQVIQRTDATYGSAGYIGFSVFSDVMEIDDFGGGTVVPATLPREQFFSRVHGRVFGRMR